MTLPSFNDIKYFLEVAQTKNISRAAERLGISQPSLSLAVKRLEDSLGTPLILRSKTGVQLNQAGKIFSIEAQEILGRWAQIKAQTTKTQIEVSGQFTLGCHPSVALYTLGSFLPKLMNKYPSLQFNLQHGLSRKITEAVISFNIDFAIVINPVKHPDLVLKKIAEDKVGLWIKKKTKLDKTTVLICDPELLQTQDLLKRYGKQNLTFDRVVSSSNLEVIAELTRSGLGAGILPGKVAARHKTELQPAPDKYGVFKDEIYLAYRADAQKGVARKTITEAILTELKKHLA